MAYFLTRRAIRDLADIHGYSVETFGVGVADKYIEDIYATFDLLAKKPALGAVRAKRSVPFLMYPAREHFILYEREGGDIYILTLLAQAQNIEAMVAKAARELKEEIRVLRGKMKGQ